MCHSLQDPSDTGPLALDGLVYLEATGKGDELEICAPSWQICGNFIWKKMQVLRHFLEKNACHTIDELANISVWHK